MYCKHCGQELPEEAVFCPSCGRPVGNEPPTRDGKHQQSHRPRKKGALILPLTAGSVALIVIAALVVGGNQRNQSKQAVSETISIQTVESAKETVEIEDSSSLFKETARFAVTEISQKDAAFEFDQKWYVHNTIFWDGASGQTLTTSFLDNGYVVLAVDGTNVLSFDSKNYSLEGGAVKYIPFDVDDVVVRYYPDSNMVETESGGITRQFMNMDGLSNGYDPIEGNNINGYEITANNLSGTYQDLDGNIFAIQLEDESVLWNMSPDNMICRCSVIRSEVGWLEEYGAFDAEAKLISINTGNTEFSYELDPLHLSITNILTGEVRVYFKTSDEYNADLLLNQRNLTPGNIQGLYSTTAPRLMWKERFDGREAYEYYLQIEAIDDQNVRMTVFRTFVGGLDLESPVIPPDLDSLPLHMLDVYILAYDESVDVSDLFANHQIVFSRSDGWIRTLDFRGSITCTGNFSFYALVKENHALLDMSYVYENIDRYTYEYHDN